MDIHSILKNTFQMKVTKLKREIIDGNEKLKVIDSIWVKTKRKDFEESLFFDTQDGINHDIRIVIAPPEKFQINTIYILADGKKVYVYVLDDKEENE